MPLSHVDVIILGAGIPGLSLAVALTQQGFKVALVDKEPPITQLPLALSLRVFAITLANIKAWQQLGVWERVIALSKPGVLEKIAVWDQPTGAHLQFDAGLMGVDAMGYVVNQEVVLMALYQTLSLTPLNFHFYHTLPLAVAVDDKKVMMTLSDGNRITSTVIVGADGSRSWLREKMGFVVDHKAYDQIAIVAQITTSQAHQAMARQVFLDDEILAFLPLADAHKCSIVWSVASEHGKALLSLSDADFLMHLSQAFDGRLGQLVAVSKRMSFSLSQQTVDAYIKPRAVLVGDAAHTVHPLAGQGLNMGLADVWCLAEVLLATQKKRRDMGARDSLRPYERWRKTHNAMMMQGIESFKQVFAARNRLVQQVRGVGMNTLDYLNFCKQPIVKYAMGL